MPHHREKNAVHCTLVCHLCLRTNHYVHESRENWGWSCGVAANTQGNRYDSSIVATFPRPCSQIFYRYTHNAYNIKNLRAWAWEGGYFNRAPRLKHVRYMRLCKQAWHQVVSGICWEAWLMSPSLAKNPQAGRSMLQYPLSQRDWEMASHKVIKRCWLLVDVSGSSKQEHNVQCAGKI